MDYVRNQKYFKKPNAILSIGIIAGIVAIIAGQPIGGGVLLAGTLVFLVVMIKSIPSDLEIDQQVQSEVDRLNETALNKHGLTTDQVGRVSPLVLGGYMSDMLGNNVKSLARGLAKDLGVEAIADAGISAIEDGAISGILYKKGKDGRVRSSAAEFTIFLFSENQVFIYTRQFSLVGPEVKEASSEYFYRDITSISTATTKSGSHLFTIKISGGETEEIPLGREDPDNQQKITAFRQLIRDKKNV
jgi:hypothetical protein